MRIKEKTKNQRGLFSVCLLVEVDCHCQCSLPEAFLCRRAASQSRPAEAHKLGVINGRGGAGCSDARSANDASLPQ